MNVEQVLGKLLHCDNLSPLLKKKAPKAWLRLLYSPHQAFIHLDKILLSLLFSRGLTVPAVSVSPCLKMLQLLNHLHSLFMESLQHVHVSLLLRSPHSTPDVASPGLHSGAEVTSLDLLEMFLLVQGGCRLSLPLQPIVVLPPTKTPKFFSAELLSSQLVTSVYWCLGLSLVVQLP